MRRALQKPRVDVENIAREGLAARGTAQQQRKLTVGAGVMREVIIDNENVGAWKLVRS
jgi:hypothetical protein